MQIRWKNCTFLRQTRSYRISIVSRVSIVSVACTRTQKPDRIRRQWTLTPRARKAAKWAHRTPWGGTLALGKREQRTPRGDTKHRTPRTPNSISGKGRNLLSLFQFHGDDGTEEGGEGVVTAVLGFGGVGIVVWRGLGEQGCLRVG